MEKRDFALRSSRQTSAREDKYCEFTLTTRLAGLLLSKCFNSKHSSCFKMDSEKNREMAAQTDEAILNPPSASEIPWWKQPVLRNLYLMMPFLFLGSTTLGYDGSLLNGLQTM